MATNQLANADGAELEPRPCVQGGAESFRSVWISDFHLGTRRCKAAELLHFLRTYRAEYLYLLGDIIDGWNFGSTWHWDALQTAVIAEIGAWRRSGARVIFLPGNHDSDNSDLIRALCGPIEVAGDRIHRTAQGMRMLVIHGHQFKGSCDPDLWLSLVGARAYNTALNINLWYNRKTGDHGRQRVGSRLRRHIKHAVHSLIDFDDRPVYEAAADRRVDGVICGHTHRPDFHTIGPFLYYNDGDWVQSRTALVERTNGAMELMQYGSGRMHRFESCETRWAAA